MLTTHFGTATRRVSIYSESAMNWSFRTTSANDRTERFPLEVNQGNQYAIVRGLRHRILTSSYAAFVQVSLWPGYSSVACSS